MCILHLHIWITPKCIRIRGSNNNDCAIHSSDKSPSLTKVPAYHSGSSIKYLGRKLWKSAAISMRRRLCRDPPTARCSIESNPKNTFPPTIELHRGKFSIGFPWFKGSAASRSRIEQRRKRRLRGSLALNILTSRLLIYRVCSSPVSVCQISATVAVNRFWQPLPRFSRRSWCIACLKMQSVLARAATLFRAIDTRNRRLGWVRRANNSSGTRRDAAGLPELVHGYSRERITYARDEVFKVSSLNHGERVDVMGEMREMRFNCY